jgi:hypothetical protein
LNGASFDYQGWAQVAVAIVALVIAPVPISAWAIKYLYNIRASCRAVDPDPSGQSNAWDVLFRNRSRLFGGFSIFIFPEKAGNAVLAFQSLSPSGGGLVANVVLIEGALEVKIVRFARKRDLSLRLRFAAPDFPSFESGERQAIRRIIGMPSRSAEFVLALTYHRMMLVILVYAAWTLLIIGAMLYGVFNNG